MKRVYSVLIAEDESEIRRALAAMVEEHPSFRVAGCAGDGKAALRMIEALRPDVLMTDIRMPYMDGLELLQALDAAASGSRQSSSAATAAFPMRGLP